jgi:hypothetical protein
MRKRSHILAMVAIVLSTVAAGVDSDPQHFGVTTLPTRIVDPSGGSSYLWIAASGLVDAEGHLDEIFLPDKWENLAARLEQWTAEARAAAAAGAEPPPCIGLVTKISYIPGSEPELERFSDAIESAETVLLGTVRGSAGGFLRGRAGHLLEIEVDERLRESPLHAASPYVYLFYYGGEVSIGAACITHSYGGRWPLPPAVGDQVIVFPREGRAAVDDDAAIIALDPRGFEMVFGNSDRLSILPGLRELPDLQKENDIQGVWRLTQEALERGKREGVSR